MRLLGLGLASLLVPLAACGGDDPAAPDAAVFDAAVPDAEIPDAVPPPDSAPPADLTCVGVALPSTATFPIVIDGNANSASTSGQAPLAGATAEAYENGNATALATDVSADGTGADPIGTFQLTIATGAGPMDGYLKGVAGGFLDTYLYPPQPLTASTDQAPLLFLSSSTVSLLGFAGGATQSASLGFVAGLVLDCSGAPVVGATISVSPTSTTPLTTIVYAGANGTPDQNATSTGPLGIAFIFNVPTGDTVVDAELDGQSFREHTIVARAGAVTTTAVAPGPITAP